MLGGGEPFEAHDLENAEQGNEYAHHKGGSNHAFDISGQIRLPALDFIAPLANASGRQFLDLAGKIEHPASPRGTLALATAAKAKAYLDGRDHVVPQDVSDLAADILSHRTILTWRALADGQRTRQVIGEFLESVHPV